MYDMDKLNHSKYRIALIILILNTLCLLFNQHLDARQIPGLELSVFFDKNEYKPGEAIYINFKLKNTSNKPIYVNKRFFVNSESSEPEDKEVFLQITGPSGEKLPCKASYDTGFPKTDYFVLLEPKEEVTSERKKNLKAYFDLKAPGEYSVIAIYQNIYGEEIGVDVFKDKITSKPATIKIIE